MDKTEKRIILYCSLLIALVLNIGKLLALRENGIVAQYWHFDLAEYLFQLIYNFIVCYLLLYLNLKPKGQLLQQLDNKQYFKNGLYNAMLLLICIVIGGIIQRLISSGVQLAGRFWSGYFFRFALTELLVCIVIKIIRLIREGRQKTEENEHLKSAYLEAELELLKGQLNPHFLFNSLSSLSGLIRENPTLAQHYVSQLSKVFRYSLQHSGANLVTVADELDMIKAYGQLLTMRFEAAFQMDIKVDEVYLQAKIPHLSLQLLLENAAKHNIATLKKPLKVAVYVEDDYLVVCNNLQEVAVPESSTGIGLSNLNERFNILLNMEIVIMKTATVFLIKLPVQS